MRHLHKLLYVVFFISCLLAGCGSDEICTLPGDPGPFDPINCPDPVGPVDHVERRPVVGTWEITEYSTGEKFSLIVTNNKIRYGCYDFYKLVPGSKLDEDNFVAATIITHPNGKSGLYWLQERGEGEDYDTELSLILRTEDDTLILGGDFGEEELASMKRQ